MKMIDDETHQLDIYIYVYVYIYGDVSLRIRADLSLSHCVVAFIQLSVEPNTEAAPIPTIYMSAGTSRIHIDPCKRRTYIGSIRTT